MKKTFLFLLISLFVIGCSVSKEKKDTQTDQHSESFFDIVEDHNICQMVFDFRLEYDLKTPGKKLSYNYFWDGYDLENKFGPSFSKEERFYTYLTKYGDDISDYYALYLTSEGLKNFDDWFIQYKEEHVEDSNNYHFADDKNIIDGKYLLFAQNNNIDDFTVHHTNDLSLIKNTVSKYHLAICLQVKDFTIVENVSLKTNINRTIHLFRRYELKYENDSEFLIQYIFDSFEQNNVHYINYLFSYTGNRLETYPKSFENISACYCPWMGFDGINIYNEPRINLLNKSAILPRYAFSMNSLVDLLDESTNFAIIEDVFRTHKNDFLNAYLQDLDIVDGGYRFGLYDLDKVKIIIQSQGE